ncbi:MAG: DnaD domain protein [Dehalococcoidia bacterium]|nr:DnaD domain protein [Dehalococcoidia bacterium]
MMTGKSTENTFAGFPSRGRYTPVHNVFFTSLLPDFDDPVELKVTLYLFWALYQKKGYPRFATVAELLADDVLVGGLGRHDPTGALSAALESAVRRGTLLHLRLERDGRDQDLYFLNTDADRRALESLKSGELEMPGFAPAPEPALEQREKRNVFSLYESNIGMLTPIIAEELKEAESLYPQQWIEDAFREAVALNKRSWRYVSRILERWSTEGRDNGTPERHSQTADPDKYIRGKYGHLVRRR